MIPTCVLVDARTWAACKPVLLDRLRSAAFIGFDIETEDSRAHAGIQAYRKADTAKVFDVNRTTVTGFSLHIEGDAEAFYVNLAHADVENRLPWAEARQLLDAKPAGAHWIAHNATYELTMMATSLGYALDDIICTLQMAVSAYGPDEYPYDAFAQAGLGEMARLMPRAAKAFAAFRPGTEMTAEQGEVLSQVIAKESRAAHSYNGFVDAIAYGYGLKKAVQSWFGHRMTTFEEVLGGRAHMGELTGEEVVRYGCEDAYWCVRLFRRLLDHMAATNPKVIETFFTQENPMVHVYSEIWRTGLRVDLEAIRRRYQLERANSAAALRRLKAAVRRLLPFPAEPHAGLLERESWYRKNGPSYRQRLTAWAEAPDHPEDDAAQVLQVSGAVANTWAAELGRKTVGVNLTHYMPMRVLLYDLLGTRCVVEKGKVQSDAEARGRLLERLGDPTARAVLEGLNELAGIEQRMKLYLTPYLRLTDPDTGRLYPVVSSRLATRRMAASFPNPMQLAKQGESTYVRGFFRPDRDDHVIVSIDWSQIELVLIGEFSGDPKFREAYGQLPYRDLHLFAAAAILSAIEGVTVTPEQFATLKHLPDDVAAPFGFPLVDKAGRPLTPKEAYKYNRGTAGGKGANFGYWYSGALGSVATARGVAAEQMWAMTESYRQEFAVAEAWRQNLIQSGRECGYVELPDGHRRVRFEATPLWAALMRSRFQAYDQEGIAIFGQEVVRATQTRAGNQLVNALIQGSCATLAKRSILRIRRMIREKGFDARFLIPIHDELVFSVHRDQVVEFIREAKAIMCRHPDLIRTLAVTASAAVGKTFEPYHPKKAPFGQIELDEAPELPVLPRETVGKALDAANQNRVVREYLFREVA